MNCPDFLLFASGRKVATIIPVAREQHSEQLARLAQQIGWQIEVYPVTNHGGLEAEARRQVQAAFQARTGWRLELKGN